MLAAIAITLTGATGCASTPTSTTGAASAAGDAIRGGAVPTPQARSYSRADVQSTGDIGNVSRALALLDPRISTH